MTTALERAYASNESTPLLTIEFLHASLTGGALRLVQAYSDLTATLEDATTVTFTAAAIDIQLPEISTDGRQDLSISIDNTNNVAWDQIKAVTIANRITESKIICKYRPFLESDLTAPAGATYVLTVTGGSINRHTATLRATYTPIPETNFPRGRYYPSDYPGVRYV